MTLWAVFSVTVSMAARHKSERDIRAYDDARRNGKLSYKDNNRIYYSLNEMPMRWITAGWVTMLITYAIYSFMTFSPK